MKHILRFTLAFVLLATCVRPASVRNGNQTCGTAATQLSTTQTKATWVNIQAAPANTGVLAIGGSTVTVVAACAPGSGNCLTANGTFFMPPVSNTAAYDLSQIYIACTVATTDKVMFTYLQ